MIMVERILLNTLALPRENEEKMVKAFCSVLLFCSLPKFVYDSSNLMAICPNYQTGVSWFNHAMTPQNPLKNLQTTRPS